MKTAELTGAQLDYYVARADGIPAEQLSIRQVQRTDLQHCVITFLPGQFGTCKDAALAYSTSWTQGGPLIDKFRPHHMPSLNGGWWAAAGRSRFVHGSTALEAICRAIVCSKFGEEVEEIAVEAQP